MSLRVPTSTTYSRLERGLAVSLSRVQTLQGQLSSGSRISRFSDDPVGASAGLRMRAEEADWAAYGRAADDATASLGTTEGALNRGVTLLQRAADIGIAAGNGSLGADARGALADELAALRNQLADVANTQHLGRAVFGGHRATAVAADSSTTPPTYSYAGDDGKVSRQIAPTVTLAVNLDGNAVFGFDQGDGQDLFSVLGRLETAVRSGDGADLAAAQAALRPRSTAVLSSLGRIGALTNRVESSIRLGESVVDRLTEQRSEVEDVDMAQTIMRLQAATNSYQAALGAVARADLPSLADFLR